jgi:hypothetical protein
MSQRLPIPGGDDGSWGTILNDFLEVAHNADGTLQTSAVQQAGAITSINGLTSTTGTVTLNASDVNALSSVTAAGGDLTGTYPDPTVSGINGVAVSGTPSSGQVLTFAGGAWSPANLPSTTFTSRGQVQYSTTYTPGNVVLYYGEYILITSSVTTGSGTNGLGVPFISAADYIKLTSNGYFWASDYGVASSNTDNWSALQSLLILVRSLSATGSGYTVVLPSGYIDISKTIILPTQTMLVGQGLYSTALRINSGANCDVVQPEKNDSSYQASLLTALQSSLTASSLVNAYRWGIRDLTLHGNASVQSPGNYSMGLNVQTNPLTTAASSDPDFDPAGIVENVQFRACTGDGFYHNGRSAIRLTNCIAWFNNGNGYSPSFDTQIDHCQAGFNGITGFYLNHNALQAAGNKSYNNGSAAQWVSGSTYTAGSRVMYNSVPYDAINSLTNDTTPPSSDTTNWAAVSGATSPSAWGCGIYMDGNSGEITFNCDCQENTAYNWYFHDCTGAGIFASGASSNPNWNYTGSALNATNPNNYAHVCVDGSDGVQLMISCGDNSGHSSTQYRLRIVNSSTHCDIALAGDTNATFLTPDSLTLLGSGNSVRYNGVSKTSTLALQNDVAISSPQNGQVLTYSAGAQAWQNSSASGSTFYGNIFGNGSNGAVTLDGVTTYSTLTLSGSTYTVKQAGVTAFSSLTINSGITLNTNGAPIQVAGALTNNGSIVNNGSNASGATAGGSPGKLWYGGQAGRSGGTSTGSSGFNTNGMAAGTGGTGGSGVSGAGGSGGTVTSTSQSSVYANPAVVLTGIVSYSGAAQPVGGGGSGGSGAGDGTNSGGAGGGSGGVVVLLAESIVNNGSITATGGNGGTPTVGNCGGGGGGGGGTIVTYSLTALSGSGTTSVTGGGGGGGIGSGTAGTTGGTGTVYSVTMT